MEKGQYIVVHKVSYCDSSSNVCIVWLYDLVRKLPFISLFFFNITLLVLENIFDIMLKDLQSFLKLF